MNRNKQRGYTLIELIMAIGGIACIAVVLFLLYAMASFIMKLI